MKVQCDVCSRNAASVFCCADEAALCEACDLRVHRANKLAGKHRRLSLTVHSHPMCDICQEKRGFMFCQQDRAILCRDCDGPIHSANELTMKHNRFLLTGTRLSSGPIPENISKDLESVVANETFVTDTSVSANRSENSSSISEYLIKTLPGYRVEDLLEADAAVMTAKDAYYEASDMMPFMEADPEYDIGFEEFPIWVPHVPQTPLQPNLFSGGIGSTVPLHSYKQNYGMKNGRETWSDDSFMVPQINSGNSKRPRTSSAWDF